MDLPGGVRTTHPGHLLDVPTHQAARSLALLGALLPHQNLLHPAIDLMTVLAFKSKLLAGLNEPANRFQTQLLCFVLADVQSPACLTLQAHSWIGKDFPQLVMSSRLGKYAEERTLLYRGISWCT